MGTTILFEMNGQMTSPFRIISYPSTFASVHVSLGFGDQWLLKPS